MFKRLRDILEMIRFSHTLFALPFAMLAAVMAWTAPSPNDAPIRFGFRQALGILLCMVFARSAAMAFNRLVDRHIDAENPRTSGRHLPSGRLSVTSVTLFTIVMSLGFWASTLLFLPNWLPPALAMPVLLILFAYSYTKRFTSLAHFWLGVSLMLAPICTWIAIRGEFVLANPSDLVPSLLVGAAVLLWVAGFDIIYACQDVGFDVSHRLRSVPSRIGVVGALRLAALCHAGMIIALTALPLLCPQLGLGIIYWCGIGAVSMLLLYEHWLVRPDDLTRVNIAFFHVNTIVSIGLFVIGSVDLLW
ncbi:MAG: putative 4-hydroxybenzoate polyprenyltransferase [Planctomycetales bacterium]|nr:putative 4-hydroxybenzoate polyprenyltransferase [Planctomycetales bacterium]